MKHNTPTIALMGAAFVVAVGLLGFNGIISNPFATFTDSASAKDSTQSLGHVTLVLKDSDGSIKAYRQADNIVVTTGKDCISDKVFGISKGNCATPSAAFNYIGIGTGVNSQGTTDTHLVSEYTRAQGGTVSLTPANSGSGAVASQSAVFTIASPKTIQEAGLFNTLSANTGDMFAEEGSFGAVTATGGDTLTITWTVTTG